MFSRDLENLYAYRDLRILYIYLDIYIRILYTNIQLCLDLLYIVLILRFITLYHYVLIASLQYAKYFLVGYLNVRLTYFSTDSESVET